MIVLDAGVVIGAVDRRDAFHPAAVRMLDEARSAGRRLLLPMSAYSEVSVVPARQGRQGQARMDLFLSRLDVRLQPVDRAVARAAARLHTGAGSSLRLADALVLATGVVLGADEVVTTDRRWPTVEGVAVRVLAP